jgi:hypothetical protein
MSPASVAVVCAACGARNVGIQTHCLLCGSDLAQQAAMPTSAPQPAASGSGATGFCPSCGAPRTGTKFCTRCGTHL